MITAKTTMQESNAMERLAHALNNRLAALMGQLELARLDRPSSDSAHESLDLALVAAKDMAASLTALPRSVGPGAQDCRPIRDVVFGMSDLLRSVFDSTEVEFEEMDTASPPLVTSTPGQIEMLIVSLLTAGRFLFGAGRPLVLTTGAVAAQGEDVVEPGFIAIRVHDGDRSRSGIIAGVYDEAFEDQDEAARLAPGCRSALVIARSLGGSLHRDESTGHDTTITAYLPVSTRTEAVAQKPVPDAKWMAKQTGTIVLIEDDSIVRAFTRRTLELAGFSVVSVGNASEALDVVGTLDCKVDLLIIDLVLPGMHGGRLARQLEEQLDQPPVLFVSGYGNDAIQHHRLLDHGAELLHKPYDQATLVSWVSRIIAASRA